MRGAEARHWRDPLPDELPPNRAGEKAYVQMVHDAIGDMTSTTERLVIDGHKAMWRWRATGTHTGEFMGVPPSGNAIDVTGINLAVVRDGKIAELWAEFDMLDIMTQLGAIDPPAG